MPKEPEAAAAFISELIRAASAAEQLTQLQRARLLQRAAATLSRDYHYQINYSETPANSRWPGRSVYNWPEMPRLIDLFSAEEVSKELLHAVSLIKIACARLETKRAKLCLAQG